jgi:MFS family permease
MSAEPPRPTGWLNPTVLGMGLTSFLADASYETASALLPGFFDAIGAPPAALGVVEGVADAVSSFARLGAGWWTDRLPRRKPLVTGGYVLSGIGGAVFAAAAAWPLVLLGRTVAWFGRGIRGPGRNALLAEAVPAADRGKAFGFHQAGDTLGAIVGPLLGFVLLSDLQPAPGASPASPFRTVFLLTLIPGLGSALAFATLVREVRRTPHPGRKLWASLGALPVRFRWFLVGMGIFGAGDFAPTLLVYAADLSLLTPVYGHDGAYRIGILLYTLLNILHALASYPAGALSDRLGRRVLLAGGFGLGGLVMFGFAALFAGGRADLPLLIALTALAGIVLAVKEALEGAAAADLVPDLTLRGTGFGVLGLVNGIGDFLSSTMVGLLWRVSFPLGFVYAGVLMLAGATILAPAVRRSPPPS